MGTNAKFSFLVLRQKKQPEAASVVSPRSVQPSMAPLGLELKFLVTPDSPAAPRLPGSIRFRVISISSEGDGQLQSETGRGANGFGSTDVKRNFIGMNQGD